jgi:hypothetical protein
MNTCYPAEDVVMRIPKRPISHLAAVLPAVGLHHSCCREILRLNSENARLSAELDRIRAQHEDLTKSAEIWIRLYETYLALAHKTAGSTVIEVARQ